MDYKSFLAQRIEHCSKQMLIPFTFVTFMWIIRMIFYSQNTYINVFELLRISIIATFIISALRNKFKEVRIYGTILFIFMVIKGLWIQWHFSNEYQLAFIYLVFSQQLANWVVRNFLLQILIFFISSTIWWIQVLNTMQFLELDSSHQISFFLFTFYTFRLIYAQESEQRDAYDSQNHIQQQVEYLSFLSESSNIAIFAIKDQQVIYQNSQAKKIFKDKYILDILFQSEYLNKQESRFKRDLASLLNSSTRNKLIANVIYKPTSSQHIQNHFSVQAINFIIKDELTTFINLFDFTDFEKSYRESIENKYKNLFIRAFQHEIRHPLIGLMETLKQLKNLIDLILKEHEKFEGPLLTFKKKIRIVKKEVSKLLLISLQMQDIFEIQKKQFLLQYSLVDIQDYSKQALSLIKNQAQQKKIGLQIKIDRNVPKQIIIDKQRIIFVLQHLLVNSVKFSKTGNIELKIKKSKKQQEYNFIEIPYKMYAFTVSDNGCGMTQRQIESLCKIFNFDIDENMTQSMGLGLYLAEQISLQLGGRHLQIKSQLGKWTRVKFFVRAVTKIENLQKNATMNDNIKTLKSSEIPMDEILSPISHQESFENLQCDQQDAFNVIAKYNSIEYDQIKEYDHSQQCNCKSILIVDDSEFVRLSLKEVLQQHGYEVFEAKDGQEAIDIIKQKMLNLCCQEFHIITMDCEMPLLDGWQATSIIREQLKYEGLILGYTAYSSEEDLKKCQEVGMNDVLNKPTPSKKIIEIIEKLRSEHTSN